MTVCGGKEGFEEKENSLFYSSSDRRPTKRMTGGSGESRCLGRPKSDHASDEGFDMSDKSSPVRRNKVEEAKRKRKNGDYDSREVYRKIAERLMDDFGI